MKLLKKVRKEYHQYNWKERNFTPIKKLEKI